MVGAQRATSISSLQPGGAEEVILVKDHNCWNGLDNTIKYNPFIVFFMNSRLELISSNFLVNLFCKIIIYK